MMTDIKTSLSYRGIVNFTETLLNISFSKKYLKNHKRQGLLLQNLRSLKLVHRVSFSIYIVGQMILLKKQRYFYSWQSQRI